MKDLNYKKIRKWILYSICIFFVLGLISFIFHGNISKKDEYNCSGSTSSFYKCLIEILQTFALLILSIITGTNFF